MHDVVIVGIQLLAILAGILFNRSGIRSGIRKFRFETEDFRTEMQAQFAKVEDHLGRIGADLRRLEARMNLLEKRN